MNTFRPATTHEEASNICKQANLTLLEYPGKARDKSTVKCNQCGHEWQTTILNIKRGTSCSKYRVKISVPTKSTPEVEEIVSLLPQLRKLLEVSPTLISMAKSEQRRIDCAKGFLKNPAQITKEQEQKEIEERWKQRMFEIDLEYMDTMERLAQNS